MAPTAVNSTDHHRDVRPHVRSWVSQVILNSHLDRPLDAAPDFSSLQGYLEQFPGSQPTCTAEAYRNLVMRELDLQRLHFERGVHAIKSKLLGVAS